MKQKISCLIDSNEKGSDRAKALALACGESQDFDLPTHADIPVDLQFKYVKYHLYRFNDEDDNCHAIRDDKILICNVELKQIDDFWASKATGHLGTQIMTMIAEDCPGFVAVLGSLDEVHLNVPKVKSVHGNVQKRNQFDIIGDLNTARALSGNAASSNVPVMFLSSNLNLSMKYILSYVKDILTGPNFASFLPRFPVDPQGYCILASIRGLGDVSAKGLLEAYGGIHQIVNECQHNPEAIANVPINGKKLGKAKANCLIRAFGCEELS
jgi:hypothetical protein